MSIDTATADDTVAVPVDPTERTAKEPVTGDAEVTRGKPKKSIASRHLDTRKIEEPDIVKTDEIENLKSYDPFAEDDEESGLNQGAHQYIHIRIQQRNGRKTLTTVQGIPPKFDSKKILKVLKKSFACNGTIVNDADMGQVIQLQGDQRKCVLGFLIHKQEGLALDERNIKIHGF